MRASNEFVPRRNVHDRFFNRPINENYKNITQMLVVLGFSLLTDADRLGR